MYKLGDIVDYGSIICIIKNINSRSIVIRSESGNIYKVRPADISKTTNIFKSKDENFDKHLKDVK